MKPFKFDSNVMSVGEAVKTAGIDKKLQKAEKDCEYGMCIGQIREDGFMSIAFVDHKTVLKI